MAQRIRQCRPEHPDPHRNPDCGLCVLATHVREYQRHWGEPTTGTYETASEYRTKNLAAPVRKKLPCLYEGEPLTGIERAERLLDHRRKWLWCGHPEKPHGEAVNKCLKCGPTCRGYTDGIRPTAGWPIRFDEHNLYPGSVPGLRFNTSIHPHGDGYAMAFRTGWCGSDIYMTRLDKQFQPHGPAVKLELKHPRANYGREDPRLFTHGHLHLSFVGVQGIARNKIRTHMLFARLNDRFEVEDVFYPVIENRRSWEKNHSYFAHEGELYAVYGITPHKILRVRGNVTEWAHETPFATPWRGGEMRGGASPVRVEDEYWHFFHDRIEQDGHRIYRTGVYTFDARPPFAPRRCVPWPILVADPTTKPPEQYASVQFCCGAVLDGDSWVLSHGTHDRYTELHKFNKSALEREMVEVPR